MKTFWQTFILAFFFTQSWVTPAWCLQKSTEVLVAVGLSKPPYLMQDPPGGLEYDILTEAFRAVGLNFKPHFVPQNRGELLFRTKKVDAVINKLKETLEGFASDPYIEYRNVAITLQSRKLGIEKIRDLEKYSVTAFQTARTLLGPDFQKMAERNERYNEVANQNLQIEQLFRKRTDVIVCDFMIFDYFRLQNQNSPEIKAPIKIHELFPKSAYVVIFQNESLRNSFNQGLAIIRKNKKYSELLRKYSFKDPAHH